jgi:predicted TIM-barrel fold metal-dependent hydrolase
MLVDAHLHVWRDASDYSGSAPTPVSPSADVPVELLAEYMSEHGVGRAVLVQPVYPGEDNSYVADCARAQPERFAAACVVDPRLPGAADRLEYWARERGCRGLRLRPRLSGEADVFGHPSTDELWRRARALNVVVSVQANPEHLVTVGRLAEQHPEVPIVLDHMAHPDIAAGVGAPGFQALLALARYPRVFVKLSGQYYYSRQAYPYADCLDFVRLVHDRFGPARLLWGSDFPHVLLKSGYRRCLALPERAYSFLSAADLELVMGGNASRLYWGEMTAPAYVSNLV